MVIHLFHYSMILCKYQNQNKNPIVVLIIVIDQHRDLETINSYYKNIYIKPYTRIGPYMIGVLLAYGLLTNTRDVRLSKVNIIITQSTKTLIN